MIRILFSDQPSTQAEPAAPPPPSAVQGDPEITALETRIADLEAGAAADVARAQEFEHANSERSTFIHQLQDQAKRAVNAAAAAPSMARLAAMSASIEADTAQATELRKSAELKTKQAATLAREISALRCAPLAELRRQKLKMLIPVQVQIAKLHAEVHAIEHDMREFGSQFHAAAWHELGFADGDGILIETWFSRWLDARREEGLDVPDSTNNQLHIPRPTSFYSDLAINESYTRYSASCGMSAGFEAGRARSASLAYYRSR